MQYGDMKTNQNEPFLQSWEMILASDDWWMRPSERYPQSRWSTSLIMLSSTMHAPKLPMLLHLRRDSSSVFLPALLSSSPAAGTTLILTPNNLISLLVDLLLHDSLAIPPLSLPSPDQILRSLLYLTHENSAMGCWSGTRITWPKMTRSLFSFGDDYD